VLGLLHAKAHPETVAALICVAPVGSAIGTGSYAIGTGS
jgi:hypothetical protein